MLLKRKYLLVAFVLLASLLGSTSSRAQDVDYKAYTLFVYNFMKYIEWPESALKDEFVVGVIGDSPVWGELKALAQAKKPRGKTIVLKKLQSADEAAGCHIVYIASGKSSFLKPVLDKTAGKPVLVIAEREGLARKGAALSFVTLDDDVLKFEINKNAIEQHSLKIPTVLVSLGLLVS